MDDHGPRSPLFRTYRCGRRQALLGALALANTRSISIIHPADAARGWCRSDPLVEINGELVYIVFTAPQTIRKAVTGPTELVVTLPQGVQARLVSAGAHFGAGETIHFAYSSEAPAHKLGIDIKVEGRVPADEDLPLGLEFAQRTRGQKSPVRAEGRTNDWIALTTSFAPELATKRRRRKKKK